VLRFYVIGCKICLNTSTNQEVDGILREMKLNTSGKLCPICGKENEDTAPVCRHCGARLEETPTGLIARPENFDIKIESLINVDLIPEEGIGIHVAGEIKPLYVPISNELIIGRTMVDGTPASETFLDLSDLNAGTMGLSRQHVMIRRTASGYEVIDLFSRNGTWLNAERLVPHKPYPFASGSQLRIGQMRMLIMYRPLPKDS